MALVFLEGFGGYATGAHVSGSSDDLLLNFESWSGTVTISSRYSTSEGTSNYMTSSGNPSLLTKSVWSGSSTIIIGARIYIGQTTLSAGIICKLMAGSNTVGWFGYTGSGFLGWSPNTWGIGHPDGRRSTKMVYQHEWTYVECKLTLSDSSGTIDFWINDEACGSFSGLDTCFGTGNTSCTQMNVGSPNTVEGWNTNTRITDIYVDTATRHGPLNVLYQAADTAGSASNFTPSTGNNEDNVDDLGSDGDSTYNYSTTTTTKDQIAHSDSLNVSPLALQPMVMARYIPTGSANIKVGVLSGATEDLDSAVALADTYSGIPGKIYEVDPNTSSAWTASNADAAETVYEHN